MENIIEVLGKELQTYLNKSLRLECVRTSLEVAKSLGYLIPEEWHKLSNEERINIMTEIYKNATHTYKFISEAESGS